MEGVIRTYDRVSSDVHLNIPRPLPIHSDTCLLPVELELGRGRVGPV